MKNIMGVILAAGKGTRMVPFSTNYPKPILPICNKPLLQYQIEVMKGLGIEDIIIVIGHLGFEITKRLGDGRSIGVHITYIEQGETLGIAHALGKLENFIKSPFLLFLGDIFFITEDLSPMLGMLDKHSAGAVLATKIETNKEAIKRNFAVLHDENGFVKRVIEKPRYISNNLKGCGLYLFDLHIFDAVRRTPRTAMRDEYEITEAIQILIDDGIPVLHSNVINEDMNLTVAVDLLKCNMVELKRLRKKEVIGENVKFGGRVEVINSVIGDNVRIDSPLKIINSVIFSDTHVRLDRDIENLIVTPQQVIDFREQIQGQI